MVTITYSTWEIRRGKLVRTSKDVINSTYDTAMAKLKEMLRQGYKHRFKHQSYKHDLIHKKAGDIEKTVLISWAD